MADPLRRRLRARLLLALTHGSALIPGPVQDAAYALAASLARRGRLGAMARQNLSLALGDELDEVARERVLRDCFLHSSRLLRTWLRLARGAPPDGPHASRGAWIEEAVTIDPSIAILEEVMARGRGALVVSAHIGDWELMAAALRRRGLHGAVVGLRRPRDPSSNWPVAMRRAYGVETIPQDASPRRLLEVLRGGRVLGLVTDLEVRRLDGEFLPFLGRQALTMTAPAALARAARVPLVPVRCVARGPGRWDHVLSVEEPLALDACLPRREATDDLLLRMNRTFERWIRETPEQWAWHQDRWRTAPGEYDAVPLAERHRRNRERREAAE
ncbi:MAG: lysophospholipid acyltransferase family protein [Planctomycetota bacterium]